MHHDSIFDLFRVIPRRRRRKRQRKNPSRSLSKPDRWWTAQTICTHYRLLLCRKATDIKKYLSILTFCVPPISKIIIIIARRRLVVVLDRPNSQEVAPRSASIDIVQKKKKRKNEENSEKRKNIVFLCRFSTFLTSVKYRKSQNVTDMHPKTLFCTAHLVTLLGKFACQWLDNWRSNSSKILRIGYSFCTSLITSSWVSC